MLKYVVEQIHGFLIIDSVEESELCLGNGADEMSFCVFDTLEEAEAEYDYMMDTKRCWLLIQNPSDKTFRIVEYIDGPENYYVEDGEFIIGAYSNEAAALVELEVNKSKITRYVIVGNRNTGELRQFVYTGGPMSAYMDEAEECVRISNAYTDDIYGKCSGWTHRWKRYYEIEYYDD